MSLKHHIIMTMLLSTISTKTFLLLLCRLDYKVILFHIDLSCFYNRVLSYRPYSISSKLVCIFFMFKKLITDNGLSIHHKKVIIHKRSNSLYKIDGS